MRCGAVLSWHFGLVSLVWQVWFGRFSRFGFGEFGCSTHWPGQCSLSLSLPIQCHSGVTGSQIGNSSKVNTNKTGPNWPR